MEESRTERIVVAFGGNAITGPDDTGEIHEQFYHTRVAVRGIASMLRGGASVVITHGNGPQVGDALRRMEVARQEVPPRPLGVLVADSQGGIGYMVTQCVYNWLNREGIARPVVPIVTQVVVSADDPAMRDPTKPVGTRYSAERAAKLRSNGWKLAGDDRSGYRRLVASPRPIRIVESAAIASLLDQHFIVIACGGGGIPVTEDMHGDLDGVDAVVDKDLASALVAKEVQADRLILLTGVDQVMLGFGSPSPKSLDRLTVAEAERYLAAGEFPPGSMGPKIRGAVDFVRSADREALITSFEALPRALRGEDGTRIVP